jgi:4-amino-4-deoxy-L-arabinose transferase-like glycosyltransferase
LESKTIAVLLFALAIQIVGIFDHSLWTTDEPWVAEVSREMSVSGDYLIPKLSDTPFLEKPPLFYATTAIFWRIFGIENEGFGRLSSTLFAIGTLLVVFLGVKALYTESAAAFSALILATTIQFFLTSHWLKIENALTFFITSALFSFILAYRQGLKFGFILFWIFTALAFMTKGMIGIAIPLAVVAMFVLWQRDFSVIRKARVFPGILIIAFTVIGWGWVLYLRGGKDFVFNFFLYENLGRFLHIEGLYNGTNFNPFYFYLPTVLTDSFPWSILMIPALITVRKPDERMKFFCSWFFGGLLLLSIASTKRHLYLLPLFPAMAVIIGQWMVRCINEGFSRWERVVLWVLCTMLVFYSLLVPVAYVKIGGSILTAIIGFLVSIGLFLLVSLTIAKSLLEKLLLGLAILTLTWTPLIFPQLDTIRTYKPFYQEAGRIVGKSKVIGYRMDEPTISFCQFYGGFKADMASDKRIFKEMILSKAAPFVIVLPGSYDDDLIKLIKSQGILILKVSGNKWRRETQLWSLSMQSGNKTKAQ